MSKLSIDVWSDIACPWCWVGKRRLEAALADFANADEVAIRWRSFELDQAAPRELPEGQSLAGRLAVKYRLSEEAAQAMIDRMTAAGAEEGVTFRFDRVQPTNTFDGHRLIHLAEESGLGPAMKERLLRAYFTEGTCVADHGELARLAEEVGLDGALVRQRLAAEDAAAEVREDEAEARALGIQGVPFFVVDRRYGVSGAQPAEALLAVLERAWAEAALTREAVEREAAESAERPGEMCDVDGC